MSTSKTAPVAPNAPHPATSAPTRATLPEQPISREVLIEKYAKGDERSIDEVRLRDTAPERKPRRVRISLTEPQALPPYERLLGDAMRGDQTLFAREDTVEAAWRVVGGILGDATPLHPYRPGTWGPAEADRLLPHDDCWHEPRGTSR